MFGLAEIRRMNDAAALAETFPEHICEDSESVERMIEEMYVRSDDYDLIRQQRDRLAQTILGIVETQQDRVGLDFDRWWALDLRRIVEDNEYDY